MNAWSDVGVNRESEGAWEGGWRRMRGSRRCSKRSLQWKEKGRERRADKEGGWRGGSWGVAGEWERGERGEMWKRRQMGGRGWGAVKWHSWQMTSPVSQSPLLSTMICHLHFWHFSSHYQITLTEWYFLILPALEHAKNNGLHMLCTLFLCFSTSLFIFHPLSRINIRWFFDNENAASQIYCRQTWLEAICCSESFKLSHFVTVIFKGVQLTFWMCEFAYEEEQ